MRVLFYEFSSDEDVIDKTFSRVEGVTDILSNSKDKKTFDIKV